MPRIHLTALFALLAATFLAVGLSTPRHASAADDAGIKTLIDQFTSAFNGHDSHAVAMCFTDDADFINVQQADSRGRKGIEEHFVPLFSGRLKNAHRTYTLKNIRSITPDVATVTMDYVLDDTTGANGETVPPRKGLYDWTVVRQNGKWLISVAHESELAAAPAMVPAR
ncbi:MAG TPA: SgcJ/EcaC family oxidoreductase [Candidatus Acidoferrales bacterium]|jgi:uncharacterized protein (TIGR02246 family)|nr:SgcJ/EcaC family oxidoreductase [Candidatus Acidoferrales bacterium]